MAEIKKEAFELLKLSQYCDNTSCAYYRQVGKGNVCTNSRSKGQMYCNECRNIWVLTKGTMYFDFRTPIDKVIKTLRLLASGMGFKDTCNQTNISGSTIVDWIQKSAKHAAEFTRYMQEEMHLKQVQIDEFWAYINKKRKK